MSSIALGPWAVGGEMGGESTPEERAVKHLVRNVLDETITPTLNQLSEGMRAMVGDGDESQLPEVLRRKGLLVELMDQGRTTAEFQEKQKTHNASVETRLAALEHGMHTMRRTAMRAWCWVMKRSEEGKLMWQRVSAAVVAVIGAGKALHLWGRPALHGVVHGLGSLLRLVEGKL